MGFEHQVVTHPTGTALLLGEARSRGDRADILRFAGLLLAFVTAAG